MNDNIRNLLPSVDTDSDSDASSLRTISSESCLEEEIEDDIMIDLCSSSSSDDTLARDRRELAPKTSTTLKNIVSEWHKDKESAKEPLQTALVFMERRFHNGQVPHHSKPEYKSDDANQNFDDIERILLEPCVLTVVTRDPRKSYIALSFIIGGWDVHQFHETAHIYVSVGCAGCGLCGDSECLKCKFCRGKRICECRLKRKYAALTRTRDNRGTYIDITSIICGSLVSGTVGMQAFYFSNLSTKFYMCGGMSKKRLVYNIYEFDYGKKKYQIRRSTANPYIGGSLLAIKAVSAVRDEWGFDRLVSGFTVALSDCDRSEIDGLTYVINYIRWFTGYDSLITIQLCHARMLVTAELSLATIIDGLKLQKPLLATRWVDFKDSTPRNPIWVCPKCGNKNSRLTHEYCSTCGRLRYTVKKMMVKNAFKSRMVKRNGK